MSELKPDIVIVGAGLFGLTIAERCASVLNLKVLVIEKRDHIGGNAWSEFDAASGIEVHKYGAHLFHTDNLRVWRYVNQFTDFNTYEHRVWGRHHGQVYPLPFGLPLLNQFFRSEFTPATAEEFMKAARMNYPNPVNLAQKAMSLIGPQLYEAFVDGYTRKQWQMDPTELSPDIITRLPVRYNYDTRYFTDRFQGQPIDGYGEWFHRMVEHPNIEIMLGTEWRVAKGWFPETLVVYTGPLDAYFDYDFGLLPWRTVDFEFEHLDVDDYQGTAVINECDSHVPHTRTIEFRHFHPERNTLDSNTRGKTVIAREFSRWADVGDEPYYPVPSPEVRQMLSEYRIAADRQKTVLFGGRLGTYQYLDMHMAIASALSMFDNQIRPRLEDK